MKNIITITIKLLIITIIAGLALGVVNAVTKEPIAIQEAKAADEARQSAFPEAVSFEALDIDIPEEYAIIKNAYKAFDAGGNNIGVTVGIITKGFNAGLNLTVGIGADGLIKGVVVGENDETPGLGAKATEDWFQNQYTGKPYAEALTVVKTTPAGESEVQAITSATITSKGVTAAVNTATQFYQEMIGGAQ